MDLLWQMGLTIAAVVGFSLLHFGLLWGYLRVLGSIQAEIRPPLIWFQFVTLGVICVLGLTIVAVLKSDASTMRAGIILGAACALPALMYLTQVGADLMPDGVLFKRIYGRRIFVPFSSVRDAQITGFGYYLTVFTQNGRRLGLPSGSQNIDTLWHVLKEHEIPVPSEEEMKRAIERGRTG